MFILTLMEHITGTKVFYIDSMSLEMIVIFYSCIMVDVRRAQIYSFDRETNEYFHHIERAMVRTSHTG